MPLLEFFEFKIAAVPDRYIQWCHTGYLGVLANCSAPIDVMLIFVIFFYLKSELIFKNGRTPAQLYFWSRLG